MNTEHEVIMKNLNRAAPVLFYEKLASTNTTLKALAYEGAADGTVIAAARQTAGRGRAGKSFESPPGGLYLSMLLRPERLEDIATLTPTAAVAVCTALERCCGLKACIKWPNDILFRDKKLCGILCESAVDKSGARYAVLGIGINVNTAPEDFSPELCGIVASVLTETGRRTDMDALLFALTDELDRLFSHWRSDALCALGDYRRLCSTCGKSVDILRGEGRETAYAERIEDDYSLLVRHSDGREEKLFFGEITIRKSE